MGTVISIKRVRGRAVGGGVVMELMGYRLSATAEAQGHAIHVSLFGLRMS